MPFQLGIQVWRRMSFRWRPSSWMQLSIHRFKSSTARANSCWSMVSTSCRMASFNSFKLRGLWVYTRPFRYPQRKKSHDEKSGDLGGHDKSGDLGGHDKSGDLGGHDKSGDLGGHDTSPKRGFKRRIKSCIQEDVRHLNDIIFHTWIPNSNGMSWPLIFFKINPISSWKSTEYFFFENRPTAVCHPV